MAVSSVSSSTTSTSNKIGGLVSGMDIDELVAKLTLGSKNKIFKEQQKAQKLQWKQDAYRQITASINSFKKTYFDSLSTTNLRSANFFNPFNASSSSEYIKTTATSTSSPGKTVISEVSQLATNQKISSEATVSQELAGALTATGTFTDLEAEALFTSLSGKSITVNLNGRTRTISFDAAFRGDTQTPFTASAFKAAFQTSLDSAFGKDKSGKSLITADITGNQLSLVSSSSKIMVGGDSDTLGLIGLTIGESNKLSTTRTLDNSALKTTLSGGSYGFTINDVDFTFTGTDTLDSIMSAVNASKAGVSMSYSSLTDKFTLTAKETGSGENIEFSDTTGNLLTSLIGTTGKNVEGLNAELIVGEGDSQMSISRSSNTFSLDGTNYELLKTFDAADAATVNVQEASSSLFEPIVKFVSDYNNLMDTLNGYVKDTVNKDYQPLSDDQKAEMTEDQIKSWESKAKAGILANDSTLNGIKSKLQAMISQPGVTGGIALYNVGITSAGWQENGKLVIDEAKLKEALSTRGSDIKELFTAATNGLANKMNSILGEAVETKGVKGSRGTLIEIAGIALHSSDKDNNITKYIAASTKAITLLNTRLTSEESRYWAQFSAMESAISRLNTQSTMLTNQFSS